MQAQISCVSGRKIYLFSINRTRWDVGAGIVGAAPEPEQIDENFLAIFECDEQKRDRLLFALGSRSLPPGRNLASSPNSRAISPCDSIFARANNQKSLPDTMDPNF
jgi:hypothetical protein